MSQDSIQLARQIMSESRFLALATSSSDCIPWSSPLFFGVTEQLTFVCISSVDSTHAANIRSTGVASWSVFWGDKRPEDTDGVTFAGSAREIVAAEELTDFGNVLYDQRFPDPIERTQHPVDSAEWLRTGRRLYVFEPTSAFKVNKEDPHGVSRIELDLVQLKNYGTVRTLPIDE